MWNKYGNDVNINIVIILIDWNNCKNELNMDLFLKNLFIWIENIIEMKQKINNE